MDQEAIIDNKVLERIYALPLFSSQKPTVSKIAKGLSNDCFLVSLPVSAHLENGSLSSDLVQRVLSNQSKNVTRYFVKSLFGREVNPIGVSVEFEAIGYASGMKITPEVAYIDQKWLVQPYIEGANLDDVHTKSKEKIAVVLALLLKCHDISFAKVCLEDPTPKTSVLPSLDELVLYDIIFSELKSLEYVFSENTNDGVLTDAGHVVQNDDQQTKRQVALKLLHQISNWLNSHTHSRDNSVDISSLVFCHGDANFSNIILADTDTDTDIDTDKYLVDFECAAWAEREYDLAMLIAINEISPSQIPAITEQYRALGAIEVSDAKVKRYLPYCFALNALWFAGKAFQSPTIKSLLDKAIRQTESLSLANNLIK